MLLVDHIYWAFVSKGMLPLVSLFTRSKFWPLQKRLVKQARNGYHGDGCELPEAVSSFLRHAAENTGFYNRRFADSGLSPESITTWEQFQHLPILTKRNIVEAFPEGITSTKNEHGPWRFANTSGTVERLTSVHDFRKRDYLRATLLMGLGQGTGYKPGFKYMELPPDVCRHTCGASTTVEPRLWDYLMEGFQQRRWKDPEFISDVRGLFESQVVLRRFQLASYWSDRMVQPPEVLDECLGHIRRYRPAVLKSLPVYVYLLALHILDTGRAAPPIGLGIMPMGSSMSPHMKAVVEKAFGVPVFEDYGAAETGSLAAECAHRTGLHPFHGVVHLEVVRRGRPVSPGEPGRVLVTDFSNLALPLIRYDIGDLATVEKGECPCGRSGPRLRVLGRLHDALLRPDGSIATPDEIVDCVLRQPGVSLFQLKVRNSSAVSLSVVPRGDTKPEPGAITRDLQLLLWPEVRISTRMVPSLRPEPTGKFRFIKNQEQPLEGAI